jgi:hypothetical protein
MSRNSKIIVIIISAITLLIFIVLYFLKTFLSTFAPPKVTVTKDFISTNREFINGVTIEKIKVGSMGGNNYPIRYTVIYTTSCNIHHPTDKSPGKIEFYNPGKYSWGRRHH